MAIKFNTVKCPDCGEYLSIEEGRTKIFCSYCGAQVIIANENEHIIRSNEEAEIKKSEAEIKKSEADIKKTEADLILKMKQIEISEKNLSVRIIFTVLLGIGVLAGLALHKLSGNLDNTIMGTMGPLVAMFCAAGIIIVNENMNNQDYTIGDTAVFPQSLLTRYSKLDYYEVEEILRKAGFSNIICKGNNTLMIGMFAKPNKVEYIRINHLPPRAGKPFPADIPIEITYHSYSGR